MSDYLLKLHVEKPGTTYTDPLTGKQSESSQGHVWYEVVMPDGTSMGTAGFAPVNPKSPNPLPVLGEVKRTDASAYAGDSHVTTTYKITKNQFDTLLGFRNDPTAHGFSLTYWAVTNSCVDFVWKGLSTIGMNPGGNEGALLPMDNISSLSTLRNPAFADGGLVQIVRQPDTIDNRPLAPDGVSRLNDQQVIQAGPNQKILFIWTKDDNGNYQKVESIITLQSNGVWRSTAMIVGQYNSDGAPVKATQYNFDIAGNTTSTKALVPTAGGNWVDAPAGSPTQALEQVVGQTFTYETTTLAGTANAGMYTATEVTNTETGQVDYIIRHNDTGEAIASGSSYTVNTNDTITTSSGGSQFTHGLTDGRLLVMQNADGSGLVVGQNGNDFYFDAGSTVRLNANGGVTVSSPVVAGLHTEFTYLAGQFVQAQRIDNAVGGNTVAGYTATSTSSDGVNWSAPVYQFDTPEAASEADHAAWAGLGNGSLSQADFENIANSSAAYLVNPANTFTPPDFDPYDFGLDPIGAFYDSQSAAFDSATSIADKTLRIVSNTGEALTAAQLAGRDSNADGQLSGLELNGLNAWQDLNENGLNPTGSELSALSAALASAGVSRIRASDYTFYTQGNGRIGTAAPVEATNVQLTQPTLAGLPSYSAPAQPNPSEPVQASLLSAAPSNLLAGGGDAANKKSYRIAA